MLNVKRGLSWTHPVEMASKLNSRQKDKIRAAKVGTLCVSEQCTPFLYESSMNYFCFHSDQILYFLILWKDEDDILDVYYEATIIATG